MFFEVKKCFRNGSSLSCDVGPWSGPVVDAVDPAPGVGLYVGRSRCWSRCWSVCRNRC